MLHLYAIPFIVFAVTSGVYDAVETLKGLKLGAGIEGNSIIRFFTKYVGASKATYGYNLVKTGLFTALGAISSPVAIGGSIGGLIADGAGHIQAGLKWRFLNNGGQIDRSKSYSWWQKLLGIGWD